VAKSQAVCCRLLIHRVCSGRLHMQQYNGHGVKDVSMHRGRVERWQSPRRCAAVF
jgi:hypothetical protein